MFVSRSGTTYDPRECLCPTSALSLFTLSVPERQYPEPQVLLCESSALELPDPTSASDPSPSPVPTLSLTDPPTSTSTPIPPTEGSHPLGWTLLDPCLGGPPTRPRFRDPDLPNVLLPSSMVVLTPLSPSTVVGHPTTPPTVQNEGGRVLTENSWTEGDPIQ